MGSEGVSCMSVWHSPENKQEAEKVDSRFRMIMRSVIPNITKIGSRDRNGVTGFLCHGIPD